MSQLRQGKNIAFLAFFNFQNNNNMHTVYLSLGSNLGNRKRLLHDAIGMIGEQVGCVERESSFIETEPWGFASPNKFLNCCVKVLTFLSPHQLLETTQHIEREMGRTQKSVDGQYHDRVIDIDILLYDRVSVNDDDLVIPHPLMHERPFVMVPLREINEDV